MSWQWRQMFCDESMLFELPDCAILIKARQPELLASDEC
jgi:hypothetical protein